MLKSPLSFCMMLALASTAFAVTSISPTTPTQDADSCYQISTADELYGFANIVNSASNFTYFSGCAKLTADIVVNENLLTADGELDDSVRDFIIWSPMNAFAGKFDGQGHTISGLYVNGASYYGSFIGYIQSPSFGQDTVVVKNLGIVDSYFSSTYDAGGIAGMVNSYWPVRIENCFSNSRVMVSNANAGGIIAYGDNKTVIKNCYNLGTISGPEKVGGIVGYYDTNDGLLLNLYNAGKVTATQQKIYGKPIVGYNWSPVKHENIFYLDDGLDESDKDSMGVAVSMDQFKKGAVLYLLRNYNYEGLDASVWGQKIGTDTYPTLSGTVTGESEITLETLTLHTYEGDPAAYPEKYAPGYAFRLPPAVREGYTFHGWFADSTFAGDSLDFVADTATGTQEFWALFKKAWTISYEVDGGKIDSLMVESYTEGVGAALPRHASRDGYVFSGWYESKEFSGHATDTVRTSDTGNKVFYAKWFKKETPKQAEDGCYEISNAAELYGFAALVNGSDGIKTPQAKACGRLTKDIVVNKDVLTEDGSLNEETKLDHTPWNPIDSFAGTFDGQGHTISGLFYDDTTNYGPRMGLFEDIGPIDDGDTVIIRNVGLEGSFMRSMSSVGGIVAQVSSRALFGVTIIENCYNASTLFGKYSTAAGIVASVYSEPLVYIVNCYNVGRVGASSYTGGILGESVWSDKAILVNCLGLAPTEASYRDYNKALVGGNGRNAVTIVNSYYLETAGNKERGGYPASAEQVKNGALAYVLHNGTYKKFNGSVWGQDVGTDEYPIFSGEIKNSEVSAYTVTFHTFEGDTAKYFDAYMPGFEKPLPDTVDMKKATFLGWYGDADFSGSPLKVISKDTTGNLEFWAKINKISDVELVPNGGYIDSGLVVEYTEGVGVQLPWRVSRDSSIFAGWYDNENLTGKPITSITPEDTGNKKYYAAWFKMKMPELDEADSCYAISDAAELYGFAAFVGRKHGMSTRQNSNVCGKLTKDIVINEGVLKDGVLDSANMTTFLPWEPILAFGGDFLGGGHKISGLYISRDSTAQGFIATLNSRQDKNYNQIPIVVRDVTFEDSYIFGRGEVGGVVASISSYRSFTMVNVRFDGHVEAKNERGYTSVAGGLIGKTFATLILDSCVNMASVSGMAAGGLIGDNVGTMSISNSANLGAITGGNNGAGGFVVSSILEHEDNITNSYNAGTVKSTGGAAGLILSPRSTSLSILNSYNTGDVEGAGSAGGLVGGAETALTIFQCYNTGSVHATANSSTVGGLVVSTSKNTVIANNYNLGELWAQTYYGFAGGLVGSVSTSGDETTLLVNNYFMGTITQAHDMNPIAMKNRATSTLQAENNFFLAVEGKVSDYGSAASEEAFANDSVASLLHAYVQKDSAGAELEGGIKGNAWIQGEEYPELLTKTVFAITFVLNDGKLENAPVSYEYGDSLVLPVPTRAGYEFKGWYVTRFFEGEPVTEISRADRSDKIFYAKWEVKIYQVTVKVNNDKWGIVTGLKNDGKYKYGDNVTLKTEANQGYELAYWGDDIENNKKEISFKVVADTTVTANFRSIEPESSSSVESSSSAKSSSSSAKSSSSSAKSSSSKKDEKSSSSECKGKNCKDALPQLTAAPSFRVTVMNRDLQVAGARIGAPVAILDLQGRVLRVGRVGEANFSMPVPGAGNYLVRIGHEVQKVRVK